MMLADMLRWSAIFGGMQSDDRERGGGLFGLLAMTILAPLAATLIQLAISRSREFEADATGARLAHNPFGWRRRREARARQRRHPDAGDAADRAPVHRQSVEGVGVRPPLLDPSAARGANPPIARDDLGVGHAAGDYRQQYGGR